MIKSLRALFSVCFLSIPAAALGAGCAVEPASEEVNADEEVSSDSAEARARRCNSDSQCQKGFKCDKPGSSRTGRCVKNSCVVNNTTYIVGESFPSTDGCNTCSCAAADRVVCTKRACFPKTCNYNGATHQPGESFPSTDGCNTCSCGTNGSVACTEKACLPKTCDYNGETHQVGESFPSSDGCNTCFCGADGGVGCTKRACLPQTCDYNGATRQVGESFPSSDGCNTCSCGAGGVVGCTKKACVCNPAAETNRNYVGASPEICTRIRFACQPGTTMFSNGCGCGCEQPSDCPEFINCMPGPGPSTCAAQRTRCPLSQVAY